MFPSLVTQVRPCTGLYCAVLCCAVLCCAVLCCAVLCCAVLCCAVLCCAVLCCAVLCCAVLCCAVLCCAVLCCTVLYCTVLYYTVYYSARGCLFTCTVLYCTMYCAITTLCIVLFCAGRERKRIPQPSPGDADLAEELDIDRERTDPEPGKPAVGVGRGLSFSWGLATGVPGQENKASLADINLQVPSWQPRGRPVGALGKCQRVQPSTVADRSVRVPVRARLAGLLLLLGPGSAGVSRGRRTRRLSRISTCGACWQPRWPSSGALVSAREYSLYGRYLYLYEHDSRAAVSPLAPDGASWQPTDHHWRHWYVQHRVIDSYCPNTLQCIISLCPILVSSSFGFVDSQARASLPSAVLYWERCLGCPGASRPLSGDSILSPTCLR